MGVSNMQNVFQKPVMPRLAAPLRPVKESQNKELEGFVEIETI